MPPRTGIDANPDVDHAWREYKRTGSPAMRNYLIIHYMGSHVRQVAQRLHAQLPRQVEVDDLVDEAYEGLVDVIDRFDITRNIRFETFSSPRLYGRMLDYLRAIDTCPRLVRYRSKKVQAAVERFNKSRGRAPTTDELRAHMKLSAKMFAKYLADAHPAAMLSFNSAAGSGERSGGDDRDAMSGFEDVRRLTPLNRAEHADLRQWLVQGFARRDRLIILLYYYEQLTMKEIGRTLGCSESRVSQRLNSILDCLKARMNRTGNALELFTK